MSKSHQCPDNVKVTSRLGQRQDQVKVRQAQVKVRSSSGQGHVTVMLKSDQLHVKIKVWSRLGQGQVKGR